MTLSLPIFGRIYYRVIGSEVQILHIRHGTRAPGTPNPTEAQNGIAVGAFVDRAAERKADSPTLTSEVAYRSIHSVYATCSPLLP